MSLTQAPSTARAGRLSAVAQGGAAGTAVGWAGRCLAGRCGQVLWPLLAGVVSVRGLVAVSRSSLARVSAIEVTDARAAPGTPGEQGEEVP